MRCSSSAASGSADVETQESAEEREERIAAAEMAELESMMLQFESQQVDSFDDTNAGLTSYDASLDPSASLRHPFGSDLPPSHAPPPPPAAPAPPPVVLNPFELLRPSFPAGPPAVKDLNALKPKQFPRPDASSPEFARILYTKSWTSGLAKLNSAFKKSQLLAFVSNPTERGGLELKMDDPRLKTGTKIGKKARYWRPKKFADMSKRELAQAIMILEWGMVDPEVLPKPRVGKPVMETIPLDDRTMFLLLSPNATTIPNISRSYGVKVAFARDPQTAGMLLSLKGTKESVQQAKEEITSLPEVSRTELWRTTPVPTSADRS